MADKSCPTVSKCTIHDNDGFGIFCTGSSGGLFEENEIYGNRSFLVAFLLRLPCLAHPPPNAEEMILDG